MDVVNIHQPEVENELSFFTIEHINSNLMEYLTGAYTVIILTENYLLQHSGDVKH
jgi:hypothetical protein